MTMAEQSRTQSENAKRKMDRRKMRLLYLDELYN